MAIPSWNMKHYMLEEFDNKLVNLIRMQRQHKLRLLHLNCDWTVKDVRYTDWADFIINADYSIVHNHHENCVIIANDGDAPNQREQQNHIRNTEAAYGKMITQTLDLKAMDLFLNSHKTLTDGLLEWVHKMLTDYKACKDCGGAYHKKKDICVECARKRLFEEIFRREDENA